SRAHAEARGARPVAKLAYAESARARRDEPGVIRASVGAPIESARERSEGISAVYSMPTGVEPATSEEAETLKAAGLPVRAIASRIGQTFEPMFPFGIAFAALAVSSGKLAAAMPDVPLETQGSDGIKSILVSTVGHWRGEGVG